MPIEFNNSNRIDLIDPVSGLNKSITIDTKNKMLVIDDGSGEDFDISGDTDETVGALARKIGNLDNLDTTHKDNLVEAVNETLTDAKTGIANASTVSGQLDTIIAQMNTWANSSLLPAVNSTLIVQGTTESIAQADWAYADVPPNPTYPWLLVIHTGFDSSGLADLQSNLAVSCRAMFNPIDLPNDKLAAFCEVSVNETSTEYELSVYAKEPLDLSPISWELVIGRGASSSKVPDLALTKNPEPAPEPEPSEPEEPEEPTNSEEE